MSYKNKECLISSLNNGTWFRPGSTAQQHHCGIVVEIREHPRDLQQERERKKNAAKGGNILDVNVLYCIADDDVPVYKILKFRNNTPYLAMKLSINLNNPC